MTQAQELLARIQLHKGQRDAIKVLWNSLFPEFKEPNDRQCQVWLKFHTFDHIVEGLDTVNAKVAARAVSEAGPMDRDAVLQYASGTMKGLKRKDEENGQ